MVETSSCPGAQQWRQLLVGQLFEEAEVMEQHLAGCPLCLELLRTMRADDTLVEAVRSQAAIGVRPIPEEVQGLMQRLKQAFRTDSVSGQGERASSEDTIAGQGESLSGAFAPSYDFLTPAQGPGELGRLGPYRVLRMLGAGGMGMVFLVEDSQLLRRVALKVMLPHVAAIPHARQRFLREARATAALKHDNIVTIHQVEEASGVPYLAMELLEGESLEDRLRRERRLPLKEVLRLGREMAEGLQAAHEHGLIHRDVKPANIWLEVSPGRKSGGPRVKILDFGLARELSEETPLTQTGAIVGTPAYMAPEQADSGQVDHRCDLFSLGCVLYRMATGETPFHGETTLKTLMAVANEAPPCPREKNSDLPEAFSDLVMRLLCKDPNGRPASAAEAASALASLEAGSTREQALSAQRSVPPRWRLWAGAAAALLLVGGGLLLAQIIIHIRNKDGKVERTIELPKGGSAEIVQSGKPPIRVPADKQSPAKKEDLRIKRIASLSTDEQIKEVGAWLKEVNPDWDGKDFGRKIAYGEVVEVTLQADNLKDLTPLRALKKLKRLTITGSLRKGSLIDLSPLQDLKELTHLNFTGTPVSNLSPLKGLNLTDLRFQNTKVSDLSPLAGMKLTLLHFPGTPVADLSPLKGMPLKDLDCRNTKVSDLSPLKGMKLTRLVCEYTQVASLAPLKGMPLTFLDCHNTSVSDLSPLKGLPLTGQFNCSETGVFDLSPLMGMKLTDLRFQNTKVSDLSPLAGMKLTLLHFPGTPVADLSPLKGMPLKDLECGNTKVSDLSPLKGMKLTRLSLLGTKVSDLSPLAGMPLTYLDCHGAPVSDLSPLKGMKLSLLGLKGTKITKLSALREVTAAFLDFSGTQVSDLSPLKGMPVTELRCYATRVADLSPLKGMKLANLQCQQTKVTDLAPLKEMPLVVLTCDFDAKRDAEILRALETLKRINGKSVKEFWKEVEAKKR